MIKYTSTRGSQKKYTFTQAILKGIADDGGLFVPESIPKFTSAELQKFIHYTYQECATAILKAFETDFSEKEIVQIVNNAYSTNFDTDTITPVVHLKDTQYILELWHGPTAAFKDLALQIIPLFFEAAVKKDNAKREANGHTALHYSILVATSGDTGKAALEGYKNKESISISVFYPKGRVSKLQELQMLTQEGKNVKVFSVNGNFDDVQTLIKDIFNDAAFNNALLNEHTILSSANSINWGRLLPQIIYYFYAYAQLVSTKAITIGEQIDVSVPTGNFGNILAAYFAQKMGLPLGTLVCASNENNVLTDFIQTGTYDIAGRSLVKTTSPSMDILIASNIERLLYFITGSSEKVTVWMQELKEHKKFTIDTDTKEKIEHTFAAEWVTNVQSLSAVKEIYTDYRYLMDPHTAVAQQAAKIFMQSVQSKNIMLICSTAHWSKFVNDISPILIAPNDEKDDLKVLTRITEANENLFIHSNIAQLINKKILHQNTVNVDVQEVEAEIVKFINDNNSLSMV